MYEVQGTLLKIAFTFIFFKRKLKNGATCSLKKIEHNINCKNAKGIA